MIAPFPTVHTGFLRPIRTAKVEYWDGVSKSWPQEPDPTGGDGDPVNVTTGAWAPAPSSPEMLMVGPNSEYPLGLTFPQAMVWLWRVKKLGVNFSLSSGITASIGNQTDVTGFWQDKRTIWTDPPDWQWQSNSTTGGWANSSVAGFSIDIPPFAVQDTYSNLPPDYISYGAKSEPRLLVLPNEVVYAQPLNSQYSISSDRDPANGFTSSAQAGASAYLELGFGPVAFFDGKYWFRLVLTATASGSASASANSTTAGDSYPAVSMSSRRVSRTIIHNTPPSLIYDPTNDPWVISPNTQTLPNQQLVLVHIAGEIIPVQLVGCIGDTGLISTGDYSGVPDPSISGGAFVTCDITVPEYWTWGGAWSSSGTYNG
jgi:hypothetical protein